MMRSKLAFILLASASLAACSHGPAGSGVGAERGVESANAPVVQRTDYVFDAAAYDGSIAPSEAARLDAWFRSLQLGYGDVIYVDGPNAYASRGDVARLTGKYGLLVSDGAPVTAGAVGPGIVRVIVSRTRASVPGCPNWQGRSQPNFENRTMPSFGCAVNGNLAAMVANPGDLVYGREGEALVDGLTASKAIQSYRTAKPTGEKGLLDVNTKKEDD